MEPGLLGEMAGSGRSEGSRLGARAYYGSCDIVIYNKIYMRIVSLIPVSDIELINPLQTPWRV